MSTYACRCQGHWFFLELLVRTTFRVFPSFSSHPWDKKGVVIQLQVYIASANCAYSALPFLSPNPLSSRGRFFSRGQRHQKRLPAHINAPFHHFRIEVHRVQWAVSTECCYSHATDVIETQLSRCRLIFWLYSMFATSRSFYWLEVMICRQSLGSGRTFK